MKKTTKKTNFPSVKNDYQMNVEIAEKIIEIIESGDVQAWKKAWTTTQGLTKKEIYRLVLEDAAAVNIYTLQQYSNLTTPSGFYLTFKQIKAHDLHLNKGAKGTPSYKACSFYKYMTAEEEEALNKFIENKEEFKEEIKAVKSGKKGFAIVAFDFVDSKGKQRVFNESIEWDEKARKFMYKKFQYVLEYLFKAEDCNIDVAELWKIDSLEEEKITELKRIEKIEIVKDSYIQRAKLKFKEAPQDRAFYRRSDHLVVVPTKNQFESIEDYYQTTFHEFAHSTGHQSLLNRKTLMSSMGFGSKSYSKEELVAEMASLYVLTSLKIATDDILKNSIAYLKSWGSRLKESIQHNILSTIKQSRKATNLILNIEEAQNRASR